MNTGLTVYLYCPAFNVNVSVGVYPRHTCLHAAQPLSIHRTVRPGRAERYVQTGRTAAHQHAARHLLLSLTRHWLLANNWAPLTSILVDGHTLQRTPSNSPCLPEKLISKHAPVKSEHEIYRPTRGLNAGS